MPDDLTPEAKAEIKAAIRIVREDTFDKYVRETLSKHKPETPPTNPPTPPEGKPGDPPGGPTPPPAKDTPTDPPPTPKKGLWWPVEESE